MTSLGGGTAMMQQWACASRDWWVCGQRACIQLCNTPVQRGSQSTDAVSKAVAVHLGPLPSCLKSKSSGGGGGVGLQMWGGWAGRGEGGRPEKTVLDVRV